MNTHIFNLEVMTCLSRESAELEVLSAFAQRKPDQCSFILKEMDGGQLITELREELKQAKEELRVLQQIKELLQ